MGVNEHLGGLIGVAEQKEGSAVTAPKLSQLDFAYPAGQLDGFGTPVERVGFARFKT